MTTTKPEADQLFTKTQQADPPSNESAADLSTTRLEAFYPSVSRSAFSGPLPSPEVLRAYEAVSPGLTDRIIEMAMREQMARHELAHRTIKETFRNTQLAFSYSLVVNAILVGSGIYFALWGSKLEGVMLLVIASFSSLLVLFTRRGAGDADK